MARDSSTNRIQETMKGHLNEKNAEKYQQHYLMVKLSRGKKRDL